MSQQLNPQQSQFVLEYSKDHNATQAAVRAGYSKHTAGTQGARLLKHDGVKSALRARTTEALARLEVTEDMVLRELAAIAFSNIKRFTRWTAEGELEVIASDDIPDALSAAIESVDEQTLTSTNKDGSRIYTRVKRKVKLYGKLDALGKLAEYFGLSDSMTPRVDIHLITGIVRDPPAVTVEAEPLVEKPP